MFCAVHCVCITTCPLCATQLQRLLSNRTTLNKWMHGKGLMDNTEKCQVARAQATKTNFIDKNASGHYVPETSTKHYMRPLLSITLDTSDIYHKGAHLIPILYYIFRSCYFSYFNKLPSLPIITILSKNVLFCRWFLIHEKPVQLTRFFSAEKIAYGRVINALAYV